MIIQLLLVYTNNLISYHLKTKDALYSFHSELKLNELEIDG